MTSATRSICFNCFVWTQLVEVYHSDQDDRVDFKIAVQQYLHFRNAHARLKIKFKFQ